MTKRITQLGVLLSCILFLGACNKDLINRENKLEGIWQYRKVQETPRWSINCNDISTEWTSDQLEFILPDQVIYTDAETGDRWEGVWLLERDTYVSTTVDGNTTTNTDYVLTMTLTNPNNGELEQMTANLEWISKEKMRIVDEQRDKTRTYRLDRF